MTAPVVRPMTPGDGRESNSNGTKPVPRLKNVTPSSSQLREDGLSSRTLPFRGFLSSEIQGWGCYVISCKRTSLLFRLNSLLAKIFPSTTGERAVEAGVGEVILPFAAESCRVK